MKNQSSKVPIYILCIFIAFHSCKESPPIKESKELNDVENAYFEDYEASKFKWGYVNTSGSLVIDNIYDDTRDFHEGLAAVNFEGRWGYIDKNGVTVIPHEYPEAYPFDNKVALVKTFEDNFRFINKSGETIAELNYQDCTPNQYGLSTVSNGTLKGLIDTNGKLLLPLAYQRIEIISKDAVKVKSNIGYGIIKLPKDTLVPLIHKSISTQGIDNFLIKSNGAYRILNSDGTSLIDKEFEKAFPFYYKYTVVNDGSFKLIDKKGNTIKDLNYDFIDYAGEQKWKYRSSGKYGLLDQDGNELTKASFTFINRYSEGRIVYGISDNEWSYLDEKGKSLFAPIYPLLWDFVNGYARIINPKGVSFVNKTGEVVLESKYFEIRDFHDERARVQVFR